MARVVPVGVHATIAGAALGLLAPAVPLGPAKVAREWTADLSDKAGILAVSALASVGLLVLWWAGRSPHPVAEEA